MYSKTRYYPILVLTILLVLLSDFKAYALEKSNYKIVLNFIDAVKKNDKKKMSKMFYYPIGRKYPLPPIEDQKDFINKFDEIFDQDLLKKIKSSSLKKDWNEIGYRGILFEKAPIWLDFDGKIYSFYYESKLVLKKRLDLINKDRESLHDSLKIFENPIMKFETKNYIVRIDELKDNNFRLAYWDKLKDQSTEPNIILTNGIYTPNGSGGNHQYDFYSGSYKYSCIRFLIGEGSEMPGFFVKYNSDNVELINEKILKLN